MGWDAVIFGELTFPRGALEAWRRAPASIARVPWPSMLAPMDDDDGGDNGLVAEALAQIDAAVRALGGSPYFLRLPSEADVVSIRGLLPEDDYREVLSRLMGLVSAAAAVGATGRLHVREAGAHTGGGVELRNGRVRGKDLGRTLDAEDAAIFRQILGQSSGEVERGGPPNPYDVANEKRRRARERARAKTAVARGQRSSAKVARPSATPPQGAAELSGRASARSRDRRRGRRRRRRL